MKKLSEAILVLTTHEGRIKERLIASVHHFARFTPDAFSNYVTREFREIRDQLSTVSEEVAAVRGRWPASIESMSEEETLELANRLVHLHQIAGDEYREVIRR